jgi:DNA-directed RNA polymerase specialized sigma24 family protein
VALAQERRTQAALPRRIGSDELVVETVRRYAEHALKIARRCTQSPDDALEAYSQALLKLVRYKDDLRADTAHFWLFEVVRREAALVRKQRRRLVAVDDSELQLLIAETAESAEERVLGLDVASRAGEALAALKTDEARALTLQAAGLSYGEIAAWLGWTATKTNRALTEGRAGFRRRYAELESGEACRRWASVIAEGRDSNLADRARLRAHLRGCPGCRATVRQLHDTPAVLALVLPVTLASGPVADRHGLVARFAETVGRSVDGITGVVAERTAGVSLHLQAIADAASAAKVAAVAASAVAVTGGGIAVRQAANESAPSPVREVRAPVTSTARAPDPPPPRAAATANETPRAEAAGRERRPEFRSGAASSGAKAASAKEEPFASTPATDFEGRVQRQSPAESAPAPQGGDFEGSGGGEFGG